MHGLDRRLFFVTGREIEKWQSGLMQAKAKPWMSCSSRHLLGRTPTSACIPTAEPGENAGLPTQGNPIAEVSGAGYVRKTLARGTWVRTGDYVQYAQQTFTATGGSWSNVYGYFIATSSVDTGRPFAWSISPAGPSTCPTAGDKYHRQDGLCIGTGGKEVYMAVGDVVSGLSSIASGAYLDLRPSAGSNGSFLTSTRGPGRDLVL